MTDVSRSQIEGALKTYIDPYLQQDLITAKAVRMIAVDGGRVSVEEVLGYPAAGVRTQLVEALTAEGATVGILDADIYGPSQPRMLGAQQRPESKDGKSMEPVVAHGIQSMSIGYLIDEESPMIWRGPMVTQALTQLLNETHWHN